MQEMVVLPWKTRSRFTGSRGLALTLFFFLGPLLSKAAATQSHGAPEGLIAHQLGHILFFLGIVFLLLRIRKAHLVTPGWAEFKWFLWLMLLWNILTFAGHLFHEKVASSSFIFKSGEISAFRIETFSGLIFYLSRLDHLLLVPAFVLFFLAIKKWEQDI